MSISTVAACLAPYSWPYWLSMFSITRSLLRCRFTSSAVRTTKARSVTFFGKVSTIFFTSSNAQSR